MRKISVRAFSLLAVLLCLPAAAAPLTSEVRWKDPSSVRLEVDFPGEGYHASWELFRCDCGDLLIRSELSLPGEVVHGDILIVGNRAVLTRGYEENAQEQISPDAPALMMQLALRLLERAEPAGPSAVSAKREIAVEDGINPIHLDTGFAVGGFPPPWSVRGTVEEQDETRRRFDLRFSFSVPAQGTGEPQAGEMRLSGVAEYAEVEFPLLPAMELAGWELSWRDREGAAEPPMEGTQTLAQLRERVAAKEP